MINLQHKEPCPECPWRKTSAEGWLGGHPTSYYSDAVACGEIPACHCKDHGSNDPRTAFCAGATATMANMCMLPHKQPGAAEAVREVGKRADVFAHAALFHQHHEGEPWVHPLMRGR
ncbi:hypothetical protein DSS3P8_181 [Roseobacter phage DSS3P8]|nr:hypothetical protein DSS3P8_181 [Roseobacter phage DSS3P8]